MSASAEETVVVGGPGPRPGLIFGIYPGMTGAEQGANVVVPGPHRDEPTKAKQALTLLEGVGRPLLVRGYLVYRGGDEPAWATPENPSIYADAGRKLDLVLCYRSTDGNLAEWLAYVRQMVARYGPLADAIQVTEEPNNPHPEAGGDGASPNVRQAMIDGVITAKQEAVARKLLVNIGWRSRRRLARMTTSGRMSDDGSLPSSWPLWTMSVWTSSRMSSGRCRLRRSPRRSSGCSRQDSKRIGISSPNSVCNGCRLTVLTDQP